MDFTNKVALVTGAARSIGEAIANKLAAGGADVFLVDLNEEGLKKVTADCAANGVRAEYAVCDVSNEEAVIACVKECEQKLGKIDILINNAGVFFGEGEFTEAKSETWKFYMDVNVFGTMYFTREALKGMLDRNYGRIVNLASVAGVYGISYFVCYSATKGAIMSFTKALAKQIGDRGVTVNCVSPGNIHPEDPSEQPEDYKNMSFLGRSGTPEECANVVCFLASDEASFVSGQNYLVDGCRKRM